MATSSDNSNNDKLNTSEILSIEDLECAVCLQTCIHPVKLPCSHIFCFLCVKGIANQSSRCAMCRTEIPSDFIDNPKLVKIEEKNSPSDEYQWFYEGRNGWWQYDERTCVELETAYTAKQKSCEILVAGFLYTVDFELMLQQRRNDPSRRRRIKRDFNTVPKKGVAGLKQTVSVSEPLVESSSVASDSRIPSDPVEEAQCPEVTSSIDESDIATMARNLSETLRLIDDSSDQECEEYDLPDNPEEL